ncbi:neuroendocrine protein 7B2 isoform X2 [Anthonomus grandis grandis]|uniref:neuroendocrine protein 7B2 isoform X2 n=1 Tax=Anthonomus grandis grandis TaxID=2921223 RepID=UPI0021663242|nr:neuroendocrine protein 7B2 isoform X2 [Anthonomus grandis grandis]
MSPTLLLLIVTLSGVLCYLPNAKDNLLTGVFLRGLVNRFNGKEDGDISYLDFTDGLPLNTRALSRDMKEEQLFPLDYDNLGDVNMYPSIRDQELMQHSSLWGNQYISGGAGDGNQLLGPGLKLSKQEIKTDASLPAYCNPPNPCPVGYNAEQGCLEEFENSAAFSRSYQALQDCMCDAEHMFDCPSANNPMVEDPMDVARMDFGRLLQQSLKTHRENPFLTGEKLPVAAKKGNNMY